MRGVWYAVAVASTVLAVTAQDMSPPVCMAVSTGNCSTCHACCFDGMDSTTCASCVASECPAPVANQCVGDCNVCDQCCKPFLVDRGACDSCVAEECSTAASGSAAPAAGGVSESGQTPGNLNSGTSDVASPAPFDCSLPREMPATCSTSPSADPDLEDEALIRKNCLDQCWAPWAPCLRRPAPHGPCYSTGYILLMIAVILPYFGRVVGEGLFRLVGSGFSGRDDLARMNEYGVLDGTLEGISGEDQIASSLNRHVDVSRTRDDVKAYVEQGVTYTYSAHVQGKKDCIMGLQFKSDMSFHSGSTQKIEDKKRQQNILGQFQAPADGRLEFTFDNTYSWFTDKVIEVNVRPIDRPKQPDRRVHMSYICCKGPVEATGGSHWNEAVAYSGLTECAARTHALGRLVFWHVLQPFAYVGAFWTVSYQLDWPQYLLGALIGVREAIYLIMTLLTAVKNPTFLLIDVGACYTDRNATGENSRTKIMNGGPSFLLMYTCMPERVVDRALFSRGGVGAGAAVVPKVVGVLFDLVGCGALVYGLSRGTLPPVLAVGYCMTAVGGLVMLVEVATSRDGQSGRWSDSSTGMGGIGGGPMYDGDDLRRMDSTRVDSTISPHGSPRSSRSSGQENLREPVKVYSKSAGVWCDGHVVKRTSKLQRVKYHVLATDGKPPKEMQKDMPLDTPHVKPRSGDWR